MNWFVFVGQWDAKKGVAPGTDRIEEILLVHKINSVSKHHKTNRRGNAILVDLHFKVVGFHLYWWETNFIKVVCFGYIQKNNSVFNALVDGGLFWVRWGWPMQALVCWHVRLKG